jgi:hypothetical protein
MPNGHRRPYRVRDPQHPYRAPSPEHTSDSDDTWSEKRQWKQIAKRTIRRWRAFVRNRKHNRCSEYIRRMILKPVCPQSFFIAPMIAAFLI